MAQSQLWRIEAGGILTAEVGEFRLVVRKAEECARFLVLKRPDGTKSKLQALFASGTQDDVSAAMAAAESMLGRLRQRSGTSADL